MAEKIDFIDKKTLLSYIRKMGFYVDDVDYTDLGYEMVGKKLEDGSIVYFPIEIEGEAFAKIFRGYIKMACEVNRSNIESPH